jgi:hypothetical protein
VKAHDCIFLAISLGKAVNLAHVSHVSVQAILCADVDISTLQEAVSLAFQVAVQLP